MSDEKWGEVYTIQTARIAELEAELARSEAERSICVEDTIKMSHELEAERKDAERYQWLRSMAWGKPSYEGKFSSGMPTFSVEVGFAEFQIKGRDGWLEKLDSAVDAAKGTK